jgi:hypothetical protein
MPKRDKYHEAVRTGLEKQGWVVLHDPLNLTVDDTPLFADLGAEAVFVAERQGEKIAVEIKTFGGQSFIHQMHEALGKYGVYSTAISILYPDWSVYLAVPKTTYEIYFIKPFIQKIVEKYQVRLIVYDFENQTIVSWIEP